MKFHIFGLWEKIIKPVLYTIVFVSTVALIYVFFTLNSESETYGIFVFVAPVIYALFLFLANIFLEKSKQNVSELLYERESFYLSLLRLREIVNATINKIDKDDFGDVISKVMVRSCYKRLDALDDEQLQQELSSAPAEIAKQINLYTMMRYNRIVWDFMVGVVGEKFRSQDFEFSRKDLNVFFSHLQEQNDDIAGWSESTVNKIKQVLTKILVEVEILDTFKSTRLNPLFLCEELEEGIRRNNDLEALAAFNCFR